MSSPKSFLNPMMLAVTAPLVLLAAPVQAQTITATGLPFVISASTPAPGDTSDYDYFSTDSFGSTTVTDPTNLTNFAVQQPADANGSYGSYFYSGYASATAPGGSTEFTTIVQFNKENTPRPLLTFQLTNPAETSFNVYILTNNVAAGDPTTGGTYQLSSSGSASTASFTADSTSPEDEYQEFSVVGATVSDTFTITNTSGNGEIGGITFADSVPEPTSCACFVLGLGLLAFAVRRGHAIRG